MRLILILTIIKYQIDIIYKCVSDERYFVVDNVAGPVGKLLEQVTCLEINPNFHAVTIGLPLVGLEQNIIEDLSTDQKYGYHIVTAIRNGTIPDDLDKMEIGPLCHSR